MLARLVASMQLMKLVRLMQLVQLVLTTLQFVSRESLGSQKTL